MEAGVIVRDPNLVLPELPPGVTEVTTRRGNRAFVMHTRKHWTEVMRDCMRFNSSDKPIGGPETPARLAAPILPRKRAAGVSGLPYKD